MATKYAASTTVPAATTRSHIEQTLERYGATGFAYAWSGDLAVIEFAANGRRLRFRLPLPAEAEFSHTPTGRQQRTAPQRKSAYDQALRQRWRALYLIVKAKLEAVESGIVTFEDEFLSQTVLPDGATVAESVQAAVQRSYELGQVQPLLAIGS